MKGKKFGINPNLSRGITETINAVKNNTSTGRYEVIALSRFELDPKNPRELVITLEDIRDGLQTTDPLYATKKDEFEKLSRLGDTIKKKGLINAVVAYKRVDKYRLVAGERRLLACVLIGKEDIQAKVFDEEPPEEDLRMIQWIENQEREDLTLKERLGNIRAILAGIQKKHPFEEMTPTILKDLLSISLPQASNYLALLNASRDLQERIEAGKINNIEKGAFLSRIEDQVTREKLIKECESGASLRELQSMLSLSNKLKMDLKRTPVPKRVGKPLSRINLGVTRNPDVVKVVVESVVKRPEFQKYAPFFDKIYWEKFEEASLAFKKMVELLENENAKTKVKKVSHSFRTSKKIVQKMLERVISDGYGLKGKSRWISNAVEKFLAMPNYWELVDIASAQEDLSGLVTCDLPEEVSNKIEEAVDEVRKHFRLMEGVKSNILRASITQRLI